MKDGVIEDPTRCKFDPKVMECKGADGPACLTAPQVEAARKIYCGGDQSAHQAGDLSRASKPGSELGWGMHGAAPQPFATRQRLLQIRSVQESELGLQDPQFR